MAGGKGYDPEKKDYSAFKSWLQCYYVDGMQSLRDHNGRTMWFKVAFWPLVIYIQNHHAHPDSPFPQSFIYKIITHIQIALSLSLSLYNGIERKALAEMMVVFVFSGRSWPHGSER